MAHLLQIHSSILTSRQISERRNNKTMRKNKMDLRFGAVLILAFSIFTLTSESSAAEVTAASCSASDIQSAIDTCISTGGGTVTVPACDAFNTWGAGDRVYKDVGSTELRVVGQGTDKTKIGYTSGNQTKSPMFRFVGSGFKELGNMYLMGDGYSSSSGRIAIGIAGAVNSRIHHIITKNFAGPTGTICGTSNLLIDHCIFHKVLYGGTYGWYAYGNNSYPQDWTSNFGTNNYNIFFEDNTFYECHHPVSLFTAATVVIRYNTFSFSHTDSLYTNVLDCHSCCYGDCPSAVENTGAYNYDYSIDRGGRAYEIYNNTMNWTGSGTMAYFARVRSGSVLFSGNTVTATNPSSSIGQAIQLVCEGNNNGPACTAENGYPVDYTYSNRCDGSTDGCCDKVETSYIWNNTLTRVNDELTTYEPCGSGSVAEDKDYYLRAPNQSDDGFTWTPYVYPHPLVTDPGSQNISPPANFRKANP